MQNKAWKCKIKRFHSGLFEKKKVTFFFWLQKLFLTSIAFQEWQWWGWRFQLSRTKAWQCRAAFRGELGTDGIETWTKFWPVFCFWKYMKWPARGNKEVDFTKRKWEFEGVKFLWDLTKNIDSETKKIEECALWRAQEESPHSASLWDQVGRKRSLSLDECLCRDLMLPQFPMPLI